MKHLSSLTFFLLLFISPIAVNAQSGFNGYWVTNTFSPVTINGRTQHQKMLMFIQPLDGSNTTYRLFYYLWNKDFNPVVGPQFENGFLDRETGWIYLGSSGRGKGRDVIKLENGRLFYFLSNNAAAAGAKTTILNLTKVDDQTGLQLQAILKKKQKP
ncbi:hypothetical protein [Cerasicoccus arenae]|uniref:Uncharacterized protein n=1 Tax=Cerasicoccus arenae TaxID=424488 RepID=A0A8J3DA14_9BACT|nr:hypothetical protein [Cerasicoccus arenae]MBK1859930.1 hypothetical protein [Cerasicoccus arenae]GHB93466.1 hypothetical protein GCM10007047_06160 [Cerasicoccus arenae]